MSFWSVFFSYSMQHQWTISPSDCERDKKWIIYNWQWPAQWLDWEEAPKHFPKPNLHQKKVIVTVWWSAGHLILYSFLNSCETITSENYAQQINELHWNLQPLQLALVNRMGPILLHEEHKTTCHTTNTSKVEWIGLQSFASFAILQASQQLFAFQGFNES